MARDKKNTVDYFPHNVHSGRTIFILENKFGNNGYAVWFKTLEMLGSSENHYIDCRTSENWQFFLAKISVDEDIANSILDTLSSLGAINTFLWTHKIIWSENFVKNIQDAYKRRSSKCMQYDDILGALGVKCKHKSDTKGVNANIKPQSKVKESKVKESKAFTAPSLDEVKEYFKANSYPEYLAIKAFNHYDVAEWKDTNGNPVRNWKQKMNSVWFDETKKIKETKPERKLTLAEKDALFGEVA